MGKKNWRTSIFGVLAAIGAALSRAEGLPAPIPQIGSVLEAIGLALTGISAADANNTTKIEEKVERVLG